MIGPVEAQEKEPSRTGAACAGEKAAAFFARPMAVLRSVRRDDLLADLPAGLTVASPPY